MKLIEKFTFGMGDRFAHEGKAQLKAVVDAKAQGIHVIPVWNKSNREHTIVGSKPDSVLVEAKEATDALGWTEDFHVDADHINLSNVDGFLAASDFYTIDVADYVGKGATEEEVAALLKEHASLVGSIEVPGLSYALTITEDAVKQAADKFLAATREAGKIYRYIAEKKGAENIIAEVSVDETDTPQTPVELLLILAMLAKEGVPVQTIAPKFTGRFNKGVDYVGDLAQFEKEFDEDLCVLSYAVKVFGLPATLKLSVHSGSDKFSIYPIINRLVKKHGAGLHVKTAGTTWLEEVIGLAEAGGDALALAKEIYVKALEHYDELVAPYATVLDVDAAKLPSAETVNGWSSEEYLAALRHDLDCPDYNLHFRQFIHVSFKIAAKLGDRYLQALKDNRETIERNVAFNLLERHLKPLFQ